MRRNWDTIRTVLLAIEAGDGEWDLQSDEERAHFSMALQAGFVSSGPGGKLTVAGHDFLDAIRDPKVWATCQEVIADNGGGLPSDVLMATARMLMPLPLPAYL